MHQPKLTFCAAFSCGHACLELVREYAAKEQSWCFWGNGATTITKRAPPKMSQGQLVTHTERMYPISCYLIQ
jgi:hypothetical protein